jgi:hypothetical protein
MRLTFAAEQLRELLAHAETRWPIALRPRWGIEDPAGFWLVGDKGVYLMHNGAAIGTKQKVVYAEECNPDTMSFDQWWAAKQASFGGDDGCEFIDADVVRDALAADSPLVIEFTETTISIFTERGKH